MYITQRPNKDLRHGAGWIPEVLRSLRAAEVAARPWGDLTATSERNCKQAQKIPQQHRVRLSVRAGLKVEGLTYSPFRLLELGMLERGFEKSSKKGEKNNRDGLK